MPEVLFQYGVLPLIKIGILLGVGGYTFLYAKGLS